MNEFGKLIENLESTNDPTEKTRFIIEYLGNSNDSDKLWMIFLLSGGRLKRNFTSADLKDWTLEIAGFPHWLLEECRTFTGDQAEIMTLLICKDSVRSSMSLEDCCRFISRNAEMSEDEFKDGIKEIWQSLERDALYAFNRILTGGVKKCSTPEQLTSAIAMHEKIETYAAARIVSGKWNPETASYSDVLKSSKNDAAMMSPFPFCIAEILKGTPEAMGKRHQWIAEWSIDGIRAQLIRKNGECCLWSEGEEIITDKFPEVCSSASEFPEGTIIDGVIVCMKDEMPLGFASLQRRASLRKPSSRIMEEAPAVYIAFDVLECNGKDVRRMKLTQRREVLEAFAEKFSTGEIMISERINFASWKELSGLLRLSVKKGADGILLRHADSTYDPGKRNPKWFKLKREPFRIDAVLTCASPAPDASSALLTEYTFAVWHEEKLVTIARTGRGLGKAELTEIDSYIRMNTIERFGPVRTIKPELVLEIEFDGVIESARRKSGLALRSPRISKWYKNKQARDAGTLSSLKELLNAE